MKKLRIRENLSKELALQKYKSWHTDAKYSTEQIIVFFVTDDWVL